MPNPFLMSTAHRDKSAIFVIAFIGVIRYRFKLEWREITMKLTAKIIPIDQRRRRALERAHAQEVGAARAAFAQRDYGYEPQPLNWTEDDGPRYQVVMLKLPMRKRDGKTL